MNKKLFKIKKRAHWKNRDVITFLERLEIYINSGLPLNRAFMIISESDNSNKKMTIDEIRSSIESGCSLSKSLLDHTDLSHTVISLIKHGESSGDLSRALVLSRSILERREELSKKCLSAMTYPIVIGLFSIILTIGLIRGVMPQIIPMLKSLNVPLPLLTRIVIWLSDSLVSYGFYILFTLPIIFFVLFFSYKRFKRFRFYCHIIFMRIPLIGVLMNRYSLSLFMRSCGSLTESGMSITKSYSDTIDTIPLIPLRDMLKSKIDDLENGLALGLIIKDLKTSVPSYVSPLILAGSASGTLGTSMSRVADIIDCELDHTFRRITAMLEPIMMIFMGCMIGSIALSIMMPIYDISKVLQH